MENTIAAVSLLLSIIVFMTGIVGFIKPSLLKQNSRVKAFGKCVLVSLFLLITFIIAIPKNENTKKNQGT